MPPRHPRHSPVALHEPGKVSPSSFVGRLPNCSGMAEPLRLSSAVHHPVDGPNVRRAPSNPSHKGRRRAVRAAARRTTVFAVALATAATGMSALTVGSAPSAAAASMPVSPLVVSYYFYWYNAVTGLHLRPTDPLPTHPVASPVTSYRSVEWHRRQLSDMNRALIDVVLPVYWGEKADSWELWSSPGLDTLVEARRQMVAQGVPAPKIGMFYDTSIVAGLDLTRRENMAIFYGHVRDFFRHVPASHRALVDGRPLVWLFAPQGNRYSQATFDYLNGMFQMEFGTTPYLVRDVAWTNVTTAASFGWGSAQNGLLYTDKVASVGPGYDERQIPGRTGVYRPRDNGNWYQYNLWNALNFGRPIIAIETWNEFHEASGIGESVEYGRAYIEMTRNLVSLARSMNSG